VGPDNQEVSMFKSVEEAQKFGKDNLDVAAKSFAALSKGLQTLAADAADYTKKSFETSSATFEKLIGARTLDKAIEIQSEYARTSYESLVAQATKVGELVTDIAKESYKPYEGLLAKASGK
jgi:hypothetical protein